MSRRAMRMLAALLMTLGTLSHAVVADQNQAPASRAAGAQEYRIGVEDVLDILVWKNTELTRTVNVRPDGMISLPLINDLQAAGLTPRQLQEIIAKSYVNWFTDLDISVSVREVHSIKISVLGMVKEPGRYELRSQTTVLDALALAAGFSDFAKRDKIFVIRRSGGLSSRIDFDYLKILAGDVSANFPLLPDDIVIVP